MLIFIIQTFITFVASHKALHNLSCNIKNPLVLFVVDEKGRQYKSCIHCQKTHNPDMKKSKGKYAQIACPMSKQIYCTTRG